MRIYKKIWGLWLLLFLSLITNVTANYHGSFAKMVRDSSEKNISFLLTKLTFESDIPFGYDEFLYLTSLKIDSLVSRQQIDYAYRQLLAKRRFVYIDIDVNDFKLGKHIHFKLGGNWIFKKLDFRGIWFGKQEYAGLYAQHPGDVFDAMLHEESIKEIKAALFNNGYFNSEVDDEIIYRKKRKTIVAKIIVKRGSRFTVRNVYFDVKSTRIADQLREHFRLAFINTYYARPRIEKQVNKIREFLKENGFAQVRISMIKNIYKTHKLVDLNIIVALGKKRVLKFAGNKAFSDQQIRENFLGEDQPDWLFTPDVISEQLRHEYYKRGYWDVILNDKKIDKKNSGNGYVFNIKEGAVTNIEYIELKDFTTNLPEPEVPFWQDLLAKRQFDETLLDDGIDKLKKHYYSMGYWDFKVVEKRFIKNFQTSDYTIQFLIDKGTQRLFGGLEIEGFKDLEDLLFFKKYRLSCGEQCIPFNYDWLSEQRGFLIAYFQKLNYWYVDVQPDLHIIEIPKVSSKRVVVVWKVKLGERVTFGKVFLRGTTRLPFKTILKEVNFKEGNAWDKEKLELTRKKLKRLDLFKTVQIQPFQIAKNKSKKPILLTLVDDDPLEMRLRLGYHFTNKNLMIKNQSTPKIGASLVMRNPTNRADKLSFDGDLTHFEQKLSVDYQQPSFFNYSVMSKIKGYVNKYDQPVRIRQSNSAYGESEYTAYQKGFLFGLNDEYKRDYHWGLSIGNDWIRTTHVHGYLNLNPTMQNYTLPYLFVEPSLVIDKLDDRLNTKRGGLTFISLKCMVPEESGAIVTAKLTAEQSLFYPIWRDLIAAARLRFGYIFRRDFAHIMPIERFYLGGPYSVRGYEIDAVPPLGITIKDQTGKILSEYTTDNDLARVTQVNNTVKEYAIQGGSSMINGNFELRFPIYKMIGGVAFQDVGVLSQSGFAGFKSVWYPASGFGLRLKTPIGAIRGDIGWKWKRRFARDSAYAWYVTIGESF